ncbi:MAG: LacI family DNA-binding transcriptional regulator [Lentisphaeria bacterium]|nr:LacI family DNA-binding transcriptional regulator [Lentisphaeria bacterium]
MATLKELAELTGLSMNTVSRAIRGRGYVSEKTAKLVRDAVRKLDYHPNKAAQALRRCSSREIAVIVDSYDALHLEKLAAIKEYAAGFSHTMRVYFINEEYPNSSLKVLIPEVMENSPAGLILITSSDEVVRCGLELRKKLPCVIIAFDPVKEADCVYIDRYQGVYDAITYLYKRGRRRIAFCETYHSENRKRGYQQAVKDFGLPEIIIPGNLKNPVLIRNTGYLNGKLFAAMPNPPDAVQTSDYMASGLLAGFAAVGLKTPQDIAVIGFDNRDFAALLNPPLSTLAQPNSEVGKNAAALLFKRMEHPTGEPESIRIQMALLLRQST